MASYIDPLIEFVSANAWLAYVTLFLAALLEAQRSGKGQVVDAAMCDGAASLLSMFFDMSATGRPDGEGRRVTARAQEPPRDRE